MAVGRRPGATPGALTGISGGFFSGQKSRDFGVGFGTPKGGMAVVALRPLGEVPKSGRTVIKANLSPGTVLDTFKGPDLDGILACGHCGAAIIEGYSSVAEFSKRYGSTTGRAMIVQCPTCQRFNEVA